jgi:biotin operon repressor
MVSAPPEDDPAWSSSTLAETLGLPLATTSHHVRLLRERGLLVEVGRRQVRGAMRTFLGLSEAALDG